MSVPPPFTVKKYFDVSLPTATVQPTTISKINTGNLSLPSPKVEPGKDGTLQP